MNDDPPWLDYLSRHVGLREIPGPEHNPLIVEWGKLAGITWWTNDDDAWCAVAVNAALVQCGFPSTKSALARSFTRYGTEIQRPVRGAIAVFPRGSNPLFGHVGIIETVHADGTMTLINGNVDNQVKRSRFKVDAVLPEGLRWPPGAAAPAAAGALERKQPLGARVLRLGSRGADVEALQRDLNILNYGLAVDGEFGGRTLDAVRRFEARRGLTSDGEADPAMLSALEVAVRARRDAQVREKAAQRAAVPIAGAGIIATTGAAVQAGVDLVHSARSLDDGTVLGGLFAALTLTCIAVVLLWRFAIRRGIGDAAEVGG